MKEPWKDRHHINLVVPHDLVEKLKAVAKLQRRSVTAQITYMLEKALEGENEPTQHVR